MEGFSDGVLAFAITLLVVDIAVRPPGSPSQEFFHAWPSYLAYLVSFFTIGGAWIAHHGLTDELDRIDQIFLRLNLLFLLAIAFLPFPPVSWWKDWKGARHGNDWPLLSTA